MKFILSLLRSYLPAFRFSANRLIYGFVCLTLLSLADTSCKVKQTEKGETTGIQADKKGTEETAKMKANKLENEDTINPYGTPARSGDAVTRTEISAVDITGKEPVDDAITCLARTIYWEARGEERTIMQAIANVVMNRLVHEGFPKTICGIVKQGGGKKDCQFSWWCDGRPDSAQEEKPYEVAKEISRRALNRQLKDLTGGALYFHNRGVSPVWAREYIRTARIGRFEFYKPHGEKAK